MRAEAVAQKVEPVRPRIAQSGLRPVQGQPETRHHTIRPRQRLSRLAPAEDNEVVGIDHVGVASPKQDQHPLDRLAGATMNRFTTPVVVKLLRASNWSSETHPAA